MQILDFWPWGPLESKEILGMPLKLLDVPTLGPLRIKGNLRNAMDNPWFSDSGALEKSKKMIKEHVKNANAIVNP